MSNETIFLDFGKLFLFYGKAGSVEYIFMQSVE